MARERRVPFLVWVYAALVAHAWGGGGATTAVWLALQQGDVRMFAYDVRRDFSPDEPIQVTLEEEPQKSESSPTTEPPEPLKEPEVKVVEKKPEPKPSPTTPEPAKAEPKDKPPTIVLLPTPAAPVPPPPPPPQGDHRIAVKQHVQDPNQPDNPNAHFVGDEANKVDEESVARATSHDQDNPNPTFGGQHPGPAGTPGNSDHDRVGDSEERPGVPDHAPGEGSKTDNAPLPAATPVPAQNRPSPTSVEGPKPAPQTAGNGVRSQPTAAPPAAQAPKGIDPSVVTTDRPGDYAVDPRRKKEAVPGPSASTLPARPPGQPGFGLGRGPNARGVQLNLNMQDVVATVGEDTLRRARENDGERRRSAHRGSWNSSSFERWRPAIENYVSSVKPGNQTALNTARVPFASYLVSIHNKIHPIFADSFLDSLDALPANNPMNDYKLITHLEIVLDRDRGGLVNMGVVKTSGITAFDVAALDSVFRAQPFGKPPPAIVSPDGKVYLHWEFHRNPIFACSTMNARPFMLKGPAEQPTPPSTPPNRPTDPRERGLPPTNGDPDRNRLGRTWMDPGSSYVVMLK